MISTAGKFLIAIGDIKVSRERLRDVGDVSGLATSLKQFGQLQPVILGDGFELIAGMRRYTAAKALGWTDIWAVPHREVPESLAREIELEENIQRLDMTVVERIKAIAEIDRLKRLSDPNWSQTLTGEVAGVARQRVNEAVNLARMIEAFPELAEAKNVSQLKSWALSKVASVVRQKEVRANPAQFQALEEKVWRDDSVEAIKRVPTGSFDLVLTDPPFGIGYDNRKAGDASVSAYKDDEKSYERLLTMAPDLYRVIKPAGWLIWFLGPSWYERAKLVFREAGFVVDEIPIIWVRTAGRCYTARPDRYFARGYDMALHCIKGNPEMVVRNRPNIFEFAPPPQAEVELLVERPVELYAELIKHLTHPGEVVADFFVGSGSVLAAAAETRRNFFGIELDAERRLVALKKIAAHTPSE